MSDEPTSPKTPTSPTSTALSDGPRAHQFHLRRPSIEKIAAQTEPLTRQVRWLPEKNRFEFRWARADEEPFGVGLLEYRDKPTGLWTIFHCEVPLEHAGEGVEGEMVKALLEVARDENVKVKNLCEGEVKRYIDEDAPEDLKSLVEP